MHTHLSVFHGEYFFIYFFLKKWERNTELQALVITVYRRSIIKVYETGCVSVSVAVMCMHSLAFH